MNPSWHAQVLVIGAGPAGIAAATVAAENGCQVVVLDDNEQAGGQIWRAATVAGRGRQKPDEPKQRALERLRRSGARVLPGRRVFNAQANGTVQALHESVAGMTAEEFAFDRLILATGARECFLPFPCWTLPGVFGAGGLQALVRGGYPIAGKRVVVAGTGPLLLAVAAHLAEEGAEVVSVVEQASMARLAVFAASLWAHPRKLWQGARYRHAIWRTAYHTGSWVLEAVPSQDGQRICAVRMGNGSREWEEPCDLLACGYHLVPNTEVAALLGCEFRGSFVQVDENQRTSLPNVYCAGEPAGIAGLESALAQGELAGRHCAHKDTAKARRRVAAERVFGERLETAFALRDELRSLPHADTIVCRCEDVSWGALQGQRGWTGWTDAKLQTRCGMGPCQGRVCGPAVEFLLGWKPLSVREPLFPVPMQALCGPEPMTQRPVVQLPKENV